MCVGPRINLLFFSRLDESFQSNSRRCAPRLGPRKGLKEIAPVVVIYPENNPSIASSDEDTVHRPHIDDPTPPSPCSLGRSPFLTRQSRIHRLGNGDSRCPVRQWIGTFEIYGKWFTAGVLSAVCVRGSMFALIGPCAQLLHIPTTFPTVGV